MAENLEAPLQNMTPEEQRLFVNEVQQLRVQLLAAQAAQAEQVARLAELNNRQVVVPQRSILDRFLPQQAKAGFRVGIDANNFELRTGLIQMVQQNQFGGRATEDPYTHLNQFIEVCNTVKQNGVAQDVIRMRLFSFSLRDEARSWFTGLDKSQMGTWEELQAEFLTNYFPPSLLLKRKAAITTFKQMYDESLYEAWKRLKELLRLYPGHNIDLEMQVCHFYEGLNPHMKELVDASAGGILMKKSGAESMRLLADMALNSHQWPTDRQIPVKAAETKPEVDVVAVVKNIREEIEKLSTAQVASAAEPNMAIVPVEADYINRGASSSS